MVGKSSIAYWDMISVMTDHDFSADTVLTVAEKWSRTPLKEMFAMSDRVISMVESGMTEEEVLAAEGLEKKTT